MYVWEDSDEYDTLVQWTIWQTEDVYRESRLYQLPENSKGWVVVAVGEIPEKENSIASGHHFAIVTAIADDLDLTKSKNYTCVQPLAAESETNKKLLAVISDWPQAALEDAPTVPAYVPSELELLTNDAVKQIGQAADTRQGETVVIDMRDYHVCTLAILDAMRQHPELPVQFLFSYNNVKYQLTIPAYADLSGLPGGSAYPYAGEQQMRGNCEGFFFVAQQTGGTITVR